MKFSLIIPTIGRSDELNALFCSLEQSNNRDFEIFVIDQNEDDRVSVIIAKHKALPIKNFKVTFKSATVARNYGIQFATGDYIIFPDDDCEFFSDTLDNIIMAFDRSKADVVSGVCIDRDGNDSVCHFKKDECFLNRKNHNGRYVEITECFKSSIVSKYKYDENIGVGKFYGSGEAFDQMIRMLDDGIKVYYSPSIKFYHPNKVIDYSLPSQIRRSFFYACGFSYVCEKHRIKDARNRLKKLLPYMIYCLLFRRNRFKFYLAELAGLIAGITVENI